MELGPGGVATCLGAEAARPSDPRSGWAAAPPLRRSVALLVVEPDALLAARLRNNAGQKLPIRVLEALPRLPGLPDALSAFDVPWLRSRLDAQTFRASFPGLRAYRTHSVPAIAPAALMEGAPGPRELRVDFVGEALPLLHALEEAGVAGGLDRIVARVALRATEGEPEGPAVERFLLERRFRVRRAPGGDPDFPLLVAEFARRAEDWHALAAERTRLESALQEARAELGRSREAEEAAQRRERQDLEDRHAAALDENERLRDLLAEALGALEEGAAPAPDGAS